MRKVKLFVFFTLLCLALASFVGAYTATIYDEDGTTLLKTVSFEKGVSTSIDGIAKSDTETKYFLGFKTADGKQLHNYNIHTDYEGDLTLTAACLTREEPVPGKEFIENGDFDEDYIPFMISNGTATIVTESDGNRVLEYSRGSSYASIQHYMKWEKGRKYRISYKFKLPSAVKNTINLRYFESEQELNSNAVADNGGSAKVGKANEWVSHSADITVADTCISSYKRDALSLYSEPQTGLAGGDTFGVVYYDDISVIPFYKITYDPNGGTLSSGSVTYFLGGDTYTVDNTVIPVRAEHIFLGWGLSANATTNVSEVTLNNQDITLYARWTEASNQPMFSYNFSNNVKGIADGTMSFVAKDDAEGSDSVTLYYADDDGILQNYTPLKTIALNDGVATFGVNGSRAFPEEATQIHAVFKAGDETKYTYVYDIPEEKRIMSTEEPILRFWSLSDAHNASTGEYVLNGRSVSYNRTNALNDVFASYDAGNCDLVIFNGDSVNHSTESMFEKLGEFAKTFNDKNIPMFFNNGNHEFHVVNGSSEAPDLENGKEELFLEKLNDQVAYLKGKGYDIDKNDDDWYYSTTINGIKFIFCSTPFPNYEKGDVEYAIKDEQLLWLEEQLFDAEKSNTPVFVLSHVGMGKYIPGTSDSDGLSNVDELEAVLNRHANLFFGTAHTHTNIYADVHTVHAGNQKTQYTHYNEGSISFTFNKEYYEDGATRTYESHYCVGYYIEVYADRVVFKGRLFEDEDEGGCKYISHAQYTVMMPGADKTLPTLSISGNLTDGSTLTPVLSSGSSNISSYEWYIEGKKVSTSSTYTLKLSEENVGKKIACRVNFADGTFVSALTDEVDSAKVSFDFNGGEGKKMADQNVVPGKNFTPNTPATLPTKAGHYFAGWSVNKNATEPDDTFTATGSTLKLYAVWKEGYTVTYDLNGGTGSVPASQVAPKGEFAPNYGKPFPTKQGYYFMGWAETEDADRAAKSVNITGEKTLYAVWSAKPQWYFENLAGFVPNAYITEYKIEDGVLYYSTKNATGADMYFEFKDQKASFTAEDYPYLRIKSSAFDASGNAKRLYDSLYFATESESYSYARTRIPIGSATKMATVDGMDIIEIRIPDFVSDGAAGYTGQITKLRYDAFQSLGAYGYTDYLVFSGKRGVYKAEVTVGDFGDNTVTLSADTVNCTATVAWSEVAGGEKVSVTLVPSSGYEFTTEEDVLALTTINGQKPDTAKVLSDGSAVITLTRSVTTAKIPVKNGDTVYVYENGAISSTSKITADGTYNVYLDAEKKQYVVVNGGNTTQKYYELDDTADGNFNEITALADGVLGNDSVSVRTADPSGIRFFASVSNELKGESLNVVEYGFILTAESAYNKLDKDYTLDMALVNSGKAKKGVAYSKNENVDKYLAKDDERTSLAGVLYGIPKTDAGVKTIIASRPYYAIENSDNTLSYVYGEVTKSSLYSVAKKIYGTEGYESAWDYAKSVIDLIENDELPDELEIVVDVGRLYE